MAGNRIDNLAIALCPFTMILYSYPNDFHFIWAIAKPLLFSFYMLDDGIDHIHHIVIVERTNGDGL